MPVSTPYAELSAQLRALLEPETDWIAALANTSALLFLGLRDINWVGFYRLENEELVLGPFQGRPACVRIALGRGVCGTAAASEKTIVVPDVHAFEGHIACDAASRSEIVVPIRVRGRLFGVLDVDSPHVARFDDDDRRGLEEIANIVAAAIHRALP